MESRKNIWYRAEYQSWAVIVIACVLMLFLLWVGMSSDDYFLAYWIGALIVFFIMTLIFSIRIECDEENLYLTYGMGMLTSEFPLFAIAEAGPVKNDSLLSLLYSARGQWAIRIVLRDGKKYILPVDQAKKFAEELLRRASRE